MNKNLIFEKRLNLKLESMIKKDSILFFDLDGTLVETNYANFLSYKKAISLVIHLDIDISFDPKKRFTRQSLIEIFPNLTNEEFQKIVSFKESIYKEFLPETKIIEPFMNILKKYSKTHKTVLVTNCRRKRGEELLDFHKLKELFSECFFGGINSSSEHSNKFENALKSSNILPENVVVFEDNISEVEMAKKAGVLEKNIIYSPEAGS